MAIKTIYVDDLDGSKDSVQSIQFAVDDVTYTIDLAPHNATKLRDALAPFIERAQRLTPEARQRRGRSDKSSPAPDSATPIEFEPPPAVIEAAPAAAPESPAVPARPGREQLQAIRDWAKKAGYGVSERGRISQQIRDAFDAAHQPR